MNNSRKIPTPQVDTPWASGLAIAPGVAVDRTVKTNDLAWDGVEVVEVGMPSTSNIGRVGFHTNKGWRSAALLSPATATQIAERTAK